MMKEQAYIDILKEELIAAMGCTEPIALAYAASKAREVLGEQPTKVYVGASGSIRVKAKASCAAKIAMSVDAGILGYEMYTCGQQFYSGDGIVAKGSDATIKNIGCLGKDGMKETNQTIINMMMK